MYLMWREHGNELDGARETKDKEKNKKLGLSDKGVKRQRRFSFSQLQAHIYIATVGQGLCT